MLITKKNYKLIAIDLTKQTKTKDPQQINFIGKIEVSSEFFTKFCHNNISNGNTKIVNLLNSSENEYSKFETKNSTSQIVNLKVTIHMKIQEHF